MTRFTSPELSVMRGNRTDGSRRILAPRGIHASVAARTVVYSGQVDGAGRADAQTLGYYEFVAKSTSGDYLDVQPHMTIDLGTAPGLRDLGTNRIRPTVVSPAAEVRIAETAPSLFRLADNAYFQVVEEYRPWLRLPRGVGSSVNGASYTNAITMYVDYDRPYFDGNEIFEPKANITRSASSPYAPKPAGWVDGYRTTSVQTYRTVTLSAGYSFTFTTGGTITAWLWDVGDGTIVSGSTTTQDITVRFPAGFRYITLRVRDNTGAHYGFMRYPIWVHDAAHLPLSHFDVPRDWTGDWREIELDFFEQDVSEAVVPQGAAICVWEDDPFWGETIPDGYRDQALGWNKEDVTLFQKNKPRTTLTVTGMGEWFNRARAIPQRIQDPGSTPDSWFEMEDITLDRLVYYLYQNFSTGALIGNLFRSERSDVLKSLDLTGASLMAQMQYVVEGYMGRARFDSLNQLLLHRHYSYKDSTERGSTDIPLSLTEVDHPYESPVKITRRYYNLVASVLGAGASLNGTTNTIYNARAPGRTPAEGNSEQDMNGQNLPSSGGQDELTRLTASHFKYLNNERDSVEYELLANLDAFEPAWNEPFYVSETDSDSGLDLSNDLFLVKEVSITRDITNPQGKQITLTMEGVTTGLLSDAQMSIVPIDNSEPPDSEPPIDIPVLPIIPVTVPPFYEGVPTKGILCNRNDAVVTLVTTMTIGVSTITLGGDDRSGNLAALGVGYCVWGYSDPFHYRRFYLLTDIGLCVNDDVENTSVWSLLWTNLQLYGNAGYVGHQAFGSHMRNGWGAVVCGKAGITTTTDGWNTITQRGVGDETNYVSNYGHGSQFCKASVWLCGHDVNCFYAMKESGLYVSLWFSDDACVSWTQVMATDGDVSGWIEDPTGMFRNDQGQGCINIPYNKPGGAANTIASGLWLEVTIGAYNSPHGIPLALGRLRSTDGGENFTGISTSPGYKVSNYGRVCCPINYYTLDANDQYYPVGVDVGSGYDTIDLGSTDDDAATTDLYGTPLQWTNDYDLDGVSINGWANPDVAVAFNQDGNAGHGSPRLLMTFDHGVTWYPCDLTGLTSWTATEGVAYCEFSLFTVPGMPL